MGLSRLINETDTIAQQINQARYDKVIKHDRFGDWQLSIFANFFMKEDLFDDFVGVLKIKCITKVL